MMRALFHLVARFRRPSTFNPSACILHRLSSSRSRSRSSSSVGRTTSGAPVALIFDTETTSLVNRAKPAHDPCQPHLVQLGMILVDTSDWSRRMSLSTLVQLEDGVSIDPRAREVHGISAEDCSQFGVPRAVALDLFYSALERADLLVAHNLGFDELVMQAVACREKDNANVKQAGERPGLQRVCTMKSAKNVLKLPGRFGKDYKWPSLSEAFAYFTDGKDMENGHDAMVDAEACLAVFRGLKESGCLILEPVLERGEITLDPDHGQSEVLTETHDSTEIASLDISPFPLAKPGELLVTPNDSGFDVGGETFKHRFALRAFGGQWNPNSRHWSFEGHEDLATVKRFAGYEMLKQQQENSGSRQTQE